MTSNEIGGRLAAIRSRNDPFPAPDWQFQYGDMRNAGPTGVHCWGAWYVRQLGTVAVRRSGGHIYITPGDGSAP